jgi:hypothetical protein
MSVVFCIYYENLMDKCIELISISCSALYSINCENIIIQYIMYRVFSTLVKTRLSRQYNAIWPPLLFEKGDHPSLNKFFFFFRKKSWAVLSTSKCTKITPNAFKIHRGSIKLHNITFLTKKNCFLQKNLSLHEKRVDPPLLTQKLWRTLIINIKCWSSGMKQQHCFVYYFELNWTCWEKNYFKEFHCKSSYFYTSLLKKT